MIKNLELLIVSLIGLSSVAVGPPAGGAGADGLVNIMLWDYNVTYNWVGIFLIVAAAAAFVAEFFIGFTGLLFIGGLIALMVGLIMISQGGLLMVQLDPWLLAVMGVVLAGLIFLSINRIVNTYKRQTATGREDAIGKKALVKNALIPQGIVLFEGELWSAEFETGQVEAGEEVIVTRIEGLKLWVKNK